MRLPGRDSKEQSKETLTQRKNCEPSKEDAERGGTFWRKESGISLKEATHVRVWEERMLKDKKIHSSAGKAT